MDLIESKVKANKIASTLTTSGPTLSQCNTRSTKLQIRDLTNKSLTSALSQRNLLSELEPSGLPSAALTPAVIEPSVGYWNGIGDFDYYLDFHVQDIDECISRKKSRILSEKEENINVSEDIINPAGSENMLGERICVSVRFQDIFDQLNSIGCPDPFNVTQIAFILPALIYKSTYLNNEYMGFTMIECSFRDGNTVFLTCDERKTFVSLLVSSAMEIFKFLKNTKAWNRLVRLDAINLQTFSEIYEIMTK